ncbi:MAG TPA: metalloregulator ArsR/SmtB family transcription factor [Desulfovibrio sp.]|uniref:ArsR/SmtB family transcription factor n=1 Tax=Desulfovibrio sp. TaxID=885 RepID=UPI002BD29D0C|nr:metalloregulator ArsR/SmtB family transcription factor [Desulfovibrio sp.]HMM39286.1 metalloregulator ArsR/SmtB family transcription factor [Desulfovibrio sp.]
MSDHEKLARMFKVLSVETRLRMIGLLLAHPLCVNALARRLGITPAAVSQHLRVLRDAGLVAANRQGNFMHYRVNAGVLELWDKEMRGLLRPAAPRPGLLGRFHPDPEHKE